MIQTAVRKKFSVRKTAPPFSVVGSVLRFSVDSDATAPLGLELERGVGVQRSLDSTTADPGLYLYAMSSSKVSAFS